MVTFHRRIRGLELDPELSLVPSNQLKLSCTGIKSQSDLYKKFLWSHREFDSIEVATMNLKKLIRPVMIKDI